MLNGMACCPQHQNIVLPCRCHFKRALDVFLSANFGKVYRVCGHVGRLEIVEGTIRRNRLHPLQVHAECKQGFNRVYIEIGNERGFGRVARGNEKRFEALGARERPHRQDAIRVAHDAVER